MKINGSSEIQLGNISLSSDEFLFLVLLHIDRPAIGVMGHAPISAKLSALRELVTNHIWLPLTTGNNALSMFRQRQYLRELDVIRQRSRLET